MKKLLFVSAVVCLVMACEKPSNEIPGPGPGDGSDTTEVPDPAAPVLTLTSEAAVSVGPDGGPVTVTYTLENPAGDGEISASASDGADWCADFDCETEGTVTFTVAPNDGAAREAVVTVAYTYGGGETEDFTVTVTQDARLEPVFELTSDAEVSVDKDGGEVTITYSVTNPRADGTVSAEVPDGVDWCTDFDCGTEGTVTFNVAANTGAAREAEVTLTYTYGGTETQTLSVAVSQDSGVPPVSLLTEDVVINWPSAVIHTQGTYWEGRYCATIKESYSGLQGLKLHFYNYTADFSTYYGFPEGTYSIGDAEGDLVLLAGTLTGEDNSLSGSWLAPLPSSYQSAYYGDYAAPLVSGTLTITRTGTDADTGVRCHLEAEDDAGNTITADFTIANTKLLLYDMIL